MFQRLDELQTGTLYIVTGQAGAGKSHLAASARRSGTLWVLDTEGAAQNLQGKPGIHRRIQVVQTLSLRALMQAMDAVKRQGKPGDTVVLDSISKIFQAMRSYAQQRAGSETDRKTTIGYDEHASVNRNMQTVYTALTELKQAGFHVLLIGHLGRKYRVGESGLHDEGLRVLADELIAYEADAVLLVEREGDERTITPIVKPPRPAHLKLGRHYPASLATLYPELAEKADPARRERRGKEGATTEGRPVHADTDEPAADEEATPYEPQGVTLGEPQSTAGSATTAVASGPPRDPAEAEQRFFTRYGDVVGGKSWQAVQRYLGHLLPRPTSVEEWIAVAEQVRDRSRHVHAA